LNQIKPKNCSLETGANIGRSEQTVGLLKSNGTEMVIGGTQAVSTGQTVNSAANALIPKKKREEDNQQQR
jgi:hypothetical protein